MPQTFICEPQGTCTNDVADDDVFEVNDSFILLERQNGHLEEAIDIAQQKPLKTSHKKRVISGSPKFPTSSVLPKRFAFENGVIPSDEMKMLGQATLLTAPNHLSHRSTATKRTIPVSTYQVMFPTANDNCTPYKFEDVESAFDGVDFSPLAKKFKALNVTPRKWYEGGEDVLRSHFPELELTNTAETMTQEINLYFGLASQRHN